MKRLMLGIKKLWNRLLEIRLIAFMVRVVDNMGSDGAVDLAAGISYYVILSLFPLLLGVTALLSFFLPYAVVQEAISSFLITNVPGLEEILRPNIDSVIRLRGLWSVIGVLGFFWSGSAVFSIVNRTINRAWEESHPRKIGIRKLRDLAMSISTTLFLVVSMAGAAILSFVSPGSAFIQRIASSLIAISLLFAVFTIIYKWVPNTRTRWRLVWPGALLAAVFFELVRILLSLYFSTFPNTQLMYSSVGSIVALLIWAYLSALIVIVGTEVSFEYSRTRLKLPLKRWRLVTVKKP